MQFIDSIVFKNGELSNLDKLPNGISLNKGSKTTVKINTDITKPIFFLWTKENKNLDIVIELESNSAATIIEQFIGESLIEQTNKSDLKIELAANSSLKHYRLYLGKTSLLHKALIEVNVKRCANYFERSLYLGSKNKKITAIINLLESGANVSIGGSYITDKDQQLECKTILKHYAPNCNSDEVIYGVAKDTSKVDFKGLIFIDKLAQKTNASLQNKNLLLSDNATVSTKPELEIWADDVKCAHGATVSQIDQQALYYLQTRGIALSQAQQMLSKSLLSEPFLEINNKQIQNYILDIITEYLN